VQRVLVLGRGGAGKSTFARQLGERLGLPVVELDAHFWRAGLTPLSPQQWAELQAGLAAAPRWVMDGDLGPYDLLTPRLHAADTVFVLDFPLWRCTWRSLRRGRERGDYWRWVLSYRRRYLPQISAELAAASNATVSILRRPRDVADTLAGAQG
jgi:adenylate kinase family enzyme